MPAPHRRHRFRLDLEADTLAELVGALHYLADEIEIEARDDRQIRYRGGASTYDARLLTDQDQDAERYRDELDQWCRDQGQAARPGP